MSIFETASNVEYQSAKVEGARAVLLEVVDHLSHGAEPETIEAFCLINNSGHILQLLHVVDDILYAVLPELNQATSELIELHKEAKKNA